MLSDDMGNNLFVYTHGPHKTSLLLNKEFGITNTYGIKKTVRFKPFSTAAVTFLNAHKLKGYDLYFFEGSAPACIAPAVKTKNNQLILKGNDQIIFFMENRSFWSFYFTKIIKLDKYVDGMIAVSEMIKRDYLRHFNMNIEVAEGFIYRDINTLIKLEPNYKERNFIVIGSNPYLKGVDISVKVFLKLKEQKIIEAGTKFYLIGGHLGYLKEKGFSLDDLDRNGIVLVDFTDNIGEYISDSLFQLHLARYEPNSVAIMEGMVAGLIPLVSIKTGNRGFIENINKELIFDTENFEALFENVSTVLSSLSSKSEVLSLSKAFRSAKEIYNMEKGLDRWRKVFVKLTGGKV